MLRIFNGVELAIKPKFLPSNAPTWERDFAAAISFSLAGRILPDRQIATDFGISSDFTRMLAQEWLRTYGRNRRSALRLYGQEAFQDMELLGEIDWARFGSLDESGFHQSALRLSANNTFNSTMGLAADRLAQKIADPGTKGALAAASRELTPRRSRTIPTAKRGFPTRSKNWQALYELSQEVNSGRSPTFTGKSGRSPGYIFRTWPVWEKLCEQALTNGEWTVASQRAVPLGTRGSNAFRVRPDVVLTGVDGLRVVVDAKYKKRADGKANAMTSTDAYEALAFLDAANSKLAILLYPESQSLTPVDRPGVLREVEVINSLGRTLVAAKVTTGGLGGQNGLRDFSANVKQHVKEMIDRYSLPHTHAKEGG